MDCKKLRAARQRSGLSVKQVARRFRRHISAIYKWETGENQPLAVDLEKLAAIYGCSTLELGLER